MKKIILTLFFSLIQVTFTLGFNFSIYTNKTRTPNFDKLSNGFNIGYRAGIDCRNNELLAGYYFNIVENDRHRLITFDNNIWTNFNRIGINSTISYSNDLLAFSYSTDIFHDKNQFRVIPALGLSLGYNDLFSAGVFYNHKFNRELIYPTLAFKLIIRPSFINILSQNSDGSKW